jgi:hypothetical protein
MPYSIITSDQKFSFMNLILDGIFSDSQGGAIKIIDNVNQNCFIIFESILFNNCSTSSNVHVGAIYIEGYGNCKFQRNCGSYYHTGGNIHAYGQF